MATRRRARASKKWTRSERLRRLLLAALLAAPLACSRQTADPEPAAPPLEPSAISIDDLPVWLSARKGRYAVDLRDPNAFASGHLRGAINLQSSHGQFAQRAARFFPAGSQLALLGDDPVEAERAIRAVAARFAGSRWLVDKATRLAELGHPLRRQTTIEVRAAFELLREGSALLIDARTAEEYAEGHAPSAVLVYPDDFIRQLAFLRLEKPILVIADKGWRSSQLVSLLDHYGFKDARNVMAGMLGWKEAALPLERGDDQVGLK